MPWCSIVALFFSVRCNCLIRLVVCPSSKVVETLKNSAVHLSVKITPQLRARIVRCMEQEGYRVVSEYVSVAIHRMCREIEQSTPANVHPVSEK